MNKNIPTHAFPNDPCNESENQEQRVSKESATQAAARAAHEANRAYCLALGDESQVPWEEAPDWQVASCLAGVLGVMAGNGPEQSHACWLKEKEAYGWVYGPVKNVEKKTHPCMVPYEDLPPSQKSKDLIFVSTVRAVLSSLGWM